MSSALLMPTTHEYLRRAQRALNDYQDGRRAYLDWLERKIELELGHADAKAAAVERLMATGLSRSAAEAAARTDPEFADYCRREAKAGYQVTLGETFLRHALETAKLCRTALQVGAEAEAEEAR